MKLNFAVNFSDLNSLKGLKKIDKIFLSYLKQKNLILHETLTDHRVSTPWTNHSAEYSKFLLELSPYLDDFVAELFSIEVENLALKQSQQNFNIIYECKKKFVQRVLKNYYNHASKEINFPEISQKLKGLIGRITQEIFAENVIKWLSAPEQFESELNVAADYAIYMVLNNSSLPLFTIPRPTNPDNLIRENRIKMLAKDISLGFDYRDNEVNLENALSNAKYCIYCHHQQKDSCRFGTHNTKHEHPQVNGCPLDQKISEMNELMSAGFNIGALSVILIDNPLVAATGHRICNDCMKSCIFQKQDPVNIPLIESKILDNVLNLPYGVEIYILLTRWNPLNIESPLPKKPTNYNILVTGLGPAGFALCHYLLNEGHNIIAIDGLKITDLNVDLTKPIKDYKQIKIPLSQRVPQGFGGVAEYGITNRWDKNNLTLIRLILERRRDNFKLLGGVRLGSNITPAQAFDVGFDHIALCLGAGKPKYINSASYFIKGVKSAADFLMNLQHGGSYLAQSNSNLLLRMPVVIIGCGLTAIDSAVEAIHYYQVQVEKFLKLYQDNPLNLNNLSDEEKIIAEEFARDASLLQKAKSPEEKLDIIQQLGGVTICYRKDIKESPAYKRNHEEIEHAKAIGIKFMLNLAPTEIKADEYDYVNQVEFLDQKNNIVTLNAKTVLVAIGTEDNEFRDIIGFSNNNHRFSHFGDCNQKYSGSVVKALASAKNGYKEITKQLNKSYPNTNSSFQRFSQILDKQLKSQIYSIKEITPNMLDIAVKSPMAARNYQPGQIFRLQNFAETSDKLIKPLALSPYKVDKTQGLIYFIILKAGKSTELCRNFKVGEEIVLMGPTGSGSYIPKSQNVILIGEGIRNLALLPIAQELKDQGSKVIFFSVYNNVNDILYIDKIKDVAEETHIFILPSNSNDNININSFINKIKKLKTSKNAYIISYVTNRMLEEIKVYEQQLFKDSEFVCGILAPMQCMMKGICGQCIQKVDNDKGYIFSCAEQEYDIKKFNPKVMAKRLEQNSLLEKLATITKANY
ncbi:Putative bifunctional glutamate synthase subunit beta/2-polyprenylphenol hydroxylase domain protein [Candidatus Megaera polyxenophila]|nr:Putative bifunctional glutamate synthase subunit beta/2-polyprenylphenol hydroxylase domain protein [Candidatus Megaera polyxenophila]